MKSRTILKYQYNELGKFLCNEYAKKHDLVNKKKKAEDQITKIIANDLPDLVRQAYEKYPNYFSLKSINIWSVIENFIVQPLHYKDNYSQASKDFSIFLLDCIKKEKLDNQYSKNYGTYSPENYRELSSFKFKGLQISGSDEDNYRYYRYEISRVNIICEYIKDHKDIQEILKNYILEICKLNKFGKDIQCAFGTITTSNMLKNELPEAYDYYYKHWGKEYEKEDEKNIAKKSAKKAQCDKVEELRAAIS